MIYEIVNPSDPYTIDCPDLEIATAFNLFFGGPYALEPQDGGESVPIFLFMSNESYHKWCVERFGLEPGKLLHRVIEERTEEFADALDSVLIGDREKFELQARTMSFEQRRQFRRRWHDEQRSSLQDIGMLCWDKAFKIRQGNKHG